jgi:NFU1 iron-sulfur cluster scaffold homolog, mitochondrial
MYKIHKYLLSGPLVGKRTPNPDSLLFPLNKQIIPNKAQPLEFLNKYESSGSPLASSLFRVFGVKSIMLSPRSVTVTKDSKFNWDSIESNIVLVLKQFIETEMPFLSNKLQQELETKYAPKVAAAADGAATAGEDAPLYDRISLLIEERVRPFVQQDGGDIEFVDFEEASGKVKIRMQGACSGCPKSQVTLKLGIERMLKHYIPEIKTVENIGDIPEGEGGKEAKNDQNTSS